MDLRKSAIGNIRLLLRKAASIIVIDKGLMSQQSGSTYRETAMGVSRCLWMTRLWTLQEAYLNKELFFILKVCSSKWNASKRLKTIPYAASVYYPGLLGAERQRYLSHSHEPIDPDFTASVWKAAQ